MRLKCYKTRTLQTDKCYLAGSIMENSEPLPGTVPR